MKARLKTVSSTDKDTCANIPFSCPWGSLLGLHFKNLVRKI